MFGLIFPEDNRSREQDARIQRRSGWPQRIIDDAPQASKKQSET